MVAAAALNRDMSDRVAALIFVSPNFAVNNRAAFMMTWPAARYWLPLVLGGQRDRQIDNPERAKYWTTTYPWSALPPMGTLVKTVAALDFSKARIPALFWISDDDTVVRPDVTRRIAGQWGGPVTVVTATMGPGDDPNAHVIAGAIRSPGQTEPAVRGMLDWLAKQGVN